MELVVLLALGILVAVRASRQLRERLTLPVAPARSREGWELAARWSELARQLGLELEAELPDRPLRLVGRRGRSAITLERKLDRAGRILFAHHLRPDGLPSSVRISRIAWLPRLVPTELQTGDRDFDAQVYLKGPSAYLLAVLDASSRERLEVVSSAGALVRDGSLVYEESEKRLPGDQELSGEPRPGGTLAVLSAASDLLAVAADEVPERLARNAAKDPVAAVRARNLAELQALEGAASQALAASRRALEDRDAGVQLQAIRGLGREDLATTVALVQNEAAATPLRAAALQHVVEHAESEVAVGLLETMASADGARKLPNELALAFALAAGAAHRLDVRLESGLIDLLAHPSHEVRESAVVGLGKVGTRAAVEPLLALLHADPAAGPSRTAVRAALEQIRGFLGNVEHGTLALAPLGERGELSVAQDAAGLSLAVTEPAPVRAGQEADPDTAPAVAPAAATTRPVSLS